MSPFSYICLFDIFIKLFIIQTCPGFIGTFGGSCPEALRTSLSGLSMWDEFVYRSSLPVYRLRSLSPSLSISRNCIGFPNLIFFSHILRLFRRRHLSRNIGEIRDYNVCVRFRWFSTLGMSRCVVTGSYIKRRHPLSKTVGLTPPLSFFVSLFRLVYLFTVPHFLLQLPLFKPGKVPVLLHVPTVFHVFLIFLVFPGKNHRTYHGLDSLSIQDLV